MLNKREIFIFFLFVIAIGSLSLVSAGDSADDILNNVSCDELGIDDNIDITESDDFTDILESKDSGTFTALQNKINAAEPDSTIELENDYYYNANFGNVDGIKITKSLTINGNGHVIDGLNVSRIFQITGAGNVVLNDMVFQNADFEDWNGGAIFVDNTNLTVNSCIFEDNYASSGGSIYVRYSNFTSIHSSFKNTIIYGFGGAILSFSSNLSFKETDFSNNYAKNTGGDIYAQNSNILLIDSNFSNSSSMNFGGSISLNDGNMCLDNCTFEDCQSYWDGGGAIYTKNSVLKSNSSKFKACESLYGGAICCLNTELKINGNDFYMNSGLLYGGSIYSIYGTVAIDNSTFSYSHGAYGGVMYIRSPHMIYNITNNVFLYSYADINCPRIYIDSYNGDIPQRGNIYEDIYFAVADFDSSSDDDEEYFGYSNILTYIISNSNDYQNDLSYYADLRNDFASTIDYSTDSSEGVTVNISDEDHPNDSFIFLNYNDFDNHTIAYNSINPRNDLESRYLNVLFYNLGGDEISIFKVISLMKEVELWKNEDLESESEYNNIYLYDDGEGGRWWTLPILDDESRVGIGNDENSLILYPLTEEEFSPNEIKGKFNFNFEDRALTYNFGNIYDFKNEKSIVPIINSDNFISDLPSSYDSRDYGYVTPSDDQGSGGNCWAFAGIATLEACIKKVTGVTYDFSEDNAKNLMAVSSIYGLNLENNRGGYDTMFMAYLTSWLGPIMDEDDEYNSFSYLSIVLPSVYHIQDISFLPTRQNSEDNDEYKKAIMNNGAVAVMIEWYNSESKSYAQHAISIVGWDDNYKGYDFLGNYTKGAWIIKNSWGDDWGDHGCGYLSYQQELSGQVYEYWNAYTFTFPEGSKAYQDIYQYDFAGLSDYMVFDEDVVYYKNKFTAKDDEFLSAFSTYFERETEFTFSVRINGKDITTTDDGEPIISLIHTCSAGYHTVPLGYDLELKKGDEFEIIIKLTNSNKNYVPVCQAEELYKLSYPNNVSFFSYNGKDWFDLYNLNDYYKFLYDGMVSRTCQVACIKAFTTYWRPISNESINFKISKGHTIQYGGDILSEYYNVFDLNITLFKDYNKVLIEIPSWDDDYSYYENFVIVNINDNISYVKLVDGAAYFDFDFSREGFYKASAKLQSNYYTSRIIEFNFLGGDVSNYGSFTELEHIIDNAENGSTIYLDKDYCLDYEFEHNSPFILINKSLTIDGNGHTLNGMLKSGIFAIYSGDIFEEFNEEVTLRNIKFENGNNGAGGAIIANAYLTVFNCTFTGNSAEYGGAICSFLECHIEKSHFVSNSAEYGGAIYSEDISYLSISSSNFTDNTAEAVGGTIYSQNNLNVRNSYFKTNQENMEIIYFSYYVDEYYVYEGNLCLKNNKMDTKNAPAILFNGWGIPYRSPLNLIFNNVEANKGEHVNLCQIKDGDGNTFAVYEINVVLTNLNDKSKVISMSLDFNDQLGMFGFDTSSLDCGRYQISGSISDEYATDYSVTPGMLNIVVKSTIVAPDLNKVYGDNNNLMVTFRDGNGKVIANTNLKVTLNGNTFMVVTNANGQATIPVNLAPNTYTATISYVGDYYSSSSITTTIVVKKANPKIIASNKKFKLKVKKKKYSITLKDNLGRAIKGAKVTVKIKKKTYSATTNAKGKATFKLKLKKKGKYKATINFAGNAYYNKVSKKVKITVKK